MGLNQESREKVRQAMLEKFGSEFQTRIETGVTQTADRWIAEDGTADDFREFCLTNFATNEQEMEAIFQRFQQNLEAYYGHLHQISRQFNWALQVDIGKVYPVDYLFANLDPYAHTSEDAFKSRIAFSALLNYPLETLESKNQNGMEWSRKKWAEVRLAEEFMNRIPSDVAMKRSETYTMADDYISNYNIYMHHLVNDNGERLFPEGLKLISHWGLRDELKAQYANPEGLSRQQMIQKVMERIILQEIPQKVINSDKFDWNPHTNSVYEAGTNENVSAEAESNIRYQHLLNTYHAEKRLDPYYPHAPSLMDRRFKLNREMSEKDVEQLLISVVTSPVLKDIASLIQQRLGRPLEPFDIWYNGFKARSQYSEEQLDRKVSRMYPDVEAFEKDLPYILRRLGFSPEQAEFLAAHIKVDPSRGAGHASGAMMPSDNAHLRTRIPEGGMKYKGFNIAIHELGHNVEQVYSLNGIDYYTLNGVPNTAFTEAFAFVFQSRDMEVLDIDTESGEQEAMRALNDMWATYEISGVALTDMYIWRWMYENPDATPVELKTAMINTTREVWNKYYAPILGMQDQILLSIYSHIIDGGMYTPDYPLGHIISFQIEKYLEGRQLAPEMERMCRLGRLSPQIWMQQAVGSKVSVEPLEKAATEALKK
ncbi:MAG: hypothetical protein EH225_01745 [Calditrichaeota bacterium]|nr:MAG: hypothetical protein EH225_01745 [Calditrichota bacterium]